MRDKLDHLIDSLLVDMSTQTEPSTRKSEFRISSFPYCPIRSLLYSKGGDESFNMEFYTSIGTAVHETLQKWLTKGNFKDKIFACWKIKETGEVIGPCLYRDIPSKYNNYTILYEEITINYNGLSGHVDLVIELLPGMFVVIDFKTTNLSDKKKRFPGEWQTKYPASQSSIIQISSYSTLLRELFGLNIVAWCLIYIDRGDVISTRHNFHKVLKPWNKKKHKNFLEFIDKACDNNKRLAKLKKILDKDAEEYSPKANKLLTRIVEHRPCTDEDSYSSWMDYGFHKGYTKRESPGVKKGECELKKFCLKGNKSCMKAIASRLD